MEWLKRWLRTRTDRAEFLFVLLITFGILLVRQVRYFFLPEGQPRINEDRLVELIALELSMLGVVGTVLRVRGWTARSLGLTPTLGQTLLGPALAAATLLLWIVKAILLKRFLALDASSSSETPLVSSEIGLTVLLAISLVNGFFEELFLCGYLITVFKKGAGLPAAIGVSVGMRMLLHVYQGPTGVLNMALMGGLFAYYFARSGKLWPLIVAHILLDVIGLSLAG